MAGFQFDHVFDWTILKYQQADFASPNALVSKLNLLFSVKFNLLFGSKINLIRILGQGTAAGTSSGMQLANIGRRPGKFLGFRMNFILSVILYRKLTCSGGGV